MSVTKPTFLVLALVFCSVRFSSAQVTAGIYTNGFLTQIGVGTNPEENFFGELRLFAGDDYNNFFGIEALGQYNFKRSDWHNISGGLMLGTYEYEEGLRVGLPVLLAIKPIQAHRNFSVMLEATPLYKESWALRGSMGIRYTIGSGRQ